MHDVSSPTPPADFLAEGFTLGEWEVRPDRNEITGAGGPRRVHGKFMEVLLCLAGRGGVVTRQELFDRVWADTVVVEECLTRAVSELRKAFDDDPRRPRVIETIPKKGYRLLVPPRPLPAQSAAGGAGRVRVPPTVPARLRRLPTAATALLIPGLLVLAHLMSAGGPTGGGAPERLQLTSLPGRESFPALSPAGDRIAFVWDAGGADRLQALFVAAAGGEPVRVSADGARCAYPAWSHDGGRIAFVRVGDDRTDICDVPAAGGPERVLVEGRGGTLPLMPELSPDGSRLAYCAARPGEGGAHAVWVMDLADGSARPLTDPGAPPGADLRPRFSPDGVRLAYLRSRAGGSDIAVIPANGGRATVLPVGDRQLIDLAWDPSHPGSLVFTASDGVWRVSARGGEPRLISAGDGTSTHLSAAPAAGLLAVAETAEDRDIWRVDLGPGGSASKPGRLIASSRLDLRPSWSPDGASLVFVSDRGGDRQLWIAAADGSGPTPVTDLQDAFIGGAAWSPGGERIAFEAVIGGQSKVCVVEVASRRIAVLTPTGPHERAPSWTADGGAVYVSRYAGGTWRIGRRAIAGGGLELLTEGDGFGAIESPAGDGVFYTKLVGGHAELWRLPLSGSDEPRPVLRFDEGVRSWTVRAGGIYVCRHRDRGDGTFAIVRRGFGVDADREVTLLEITSRSSLSFDVSPDESAIVFDRAERAESDIVGWRVPGGHIVGPRLAAAAGAVPGPV